MHGVAQIAEEKIPICGKEDFSITAAAAEEEEKQERGYTGQNLQFEPRAKSLPNRTTDHSSSLTWNEKRRGVF